jgi:ubiquinol-cytochrome c reductase iron-sulfur subunit
VVKRTPDRVARLKGHDEALKDPDSEESVQPDYARNLTRSRIPEILVLVGTCTHLGCLPKQRFEKDTPEMGATWPGGYFCPCHGSRFDLAGRVFKGSPASINLRVPPYSFRNTSTLVVGVDEQGGAA